MKKNIIALWAALTTALSGIRIYQLLVLTEPETGFLREHDLSVWFFCALLILGAAALAILSRLAMKKEGVPPARNGDSRETGAALTALGASALCETVQNVFFAQPASMEVQEGWLAAMAAVGFLAAGYFLLWGITALRGKIFRAPAVVTLLPSFWLALRALYLYLEARIAVTVPAIVLPILTTVFLALWWMARARIQSGVDAAKGLLSLASLTPICLLLIVVSVLPAAVGTLCVGADVSPARMTDVTAALFAPYIFLVRFPAGEASALREG